MPLFHYALRPNGLLLLGVSETVGTHLDLFSVADARAKVYVRKAAPDRASRGFSQIGPEARGGEPYALHPDSATVPSLAEVQKKADRILAAEVGAPGVVVDERLQVLQFRGRTGPFLEHAHGEATLDLLKMAREGIAIDLRTALGRAVRQGVRVKQQPLNVRGKARGEGVRIEVVPFRVPPSEEKFYLVLFDSPSGASVSTASASGKGGSAAKKAERLPQEDAAVVRLRDELAATRESLKRVFETQEATNEQLRTANEEITSANEELQVTNEELETAKEELQSTNEELTLLNDELESRNDQLGQVNNDLQNLLTSADTPIVILDPDLRIRRFTYLAERSLHLIPGDRGRPITDIALPMSIPGLPDLVREVIEGLVPRVIEVTCAQGHRWSIEFRPYRTTDNRIDGVVVAFLDVDAFLARRAESAPS
ncbi:MAG: PAS domain-containing protein [Deltaproteobacteria bacterium]|nr:PAS domain-containing protein [Deltaproteobacteria bacterium]